jgi:hypothetical protein
MALVHHGQGLLCLTPEKSPLISLSTDQFGTKNTHIHTLSSDSTTRVSFTSRPRTEIRSLTGMVRNAG